MTSIKESTEEEGSDASSTRSTSTTSSSASATATVATTPNNNLGKKKPSLQQLIVPVVGLLLATLAYSLMKIEANNDYSISNDDQDSVMMKMAAINSDSDRDEDGNGDVYPEYVPDYPEYNEEEALEHVFYSKAAFCTEHAITSWSCGDMCDKAPIVGTDKMRYIPEGKRFRVQGYVAQIPVNNNAIQVLVPDNDSDSDSDPDPDQNTTNDNDDNDNNNNNNNNDNDNDTKCMVSFRGSLNGANWYADMLASLRPWPLDDLANAEWCQGCKAHYGFTEAYDELRTDVHQAIADLNCTRLVLAGHSLGAAIATIASFDLRSAMGYHVEATWAFGKPRIGNAEFANSFVAAATLQGVSPAIWRVVHYHDPVPRAPAHFPGIHPVTHGALEIYYTDRASSEYIVCPQRGATENQSKSCMGRWPLYYSINTDHINYLNESFAFKNFPGECKATN